jgi:hypothetical protein
VGHRECIVHDFQTEGYHIVSGGGTMFSEGYIVNGRHATIALPEDQPGPAWWDGVRGEESRREICKSIVVPPGVVHGWADVPGHVEYVIFRPSQNVLRADWGIRRLQSKKYERFRETYMRAVGRRTQSLPFCLAMPSTSFTYAVA